MSQFQLFSGSGKDDSFGLETFQFYNWGTYDGQINEISPNLKPSWLTGLNGAGKSTVLDGISTLLSPPAKRQYNMSSGAEKAERTERTYVRGAWGEERDQSSQLDGVKYLRGDDSYSALLAKFRTVKSKRTYVLAQILWLSNDKVQKIYITSTSNLDISTDLSGFASIRALKAKLREMDGVRVYDTFQEYCATFLKAFGMRSPRAVELINKTASMKEVESLTTFMRNHMLDKYDMSVAVNDLIGHFKVAEDAHKNFEKARLQTALLEPIEQNHKVYLKASQRISELDLQLEVISPYISSRLVTILEEKVLKSRDELTLLDSKKALADKKRLELEEELREIRLQLAGDETSHQVQLLEQERSSLEKEVESVGANLEKYNDFAKNLKFRLSPDNSEFLGNKRKAEALVAESSEQLRVLQDQLDKLNLTLADESRNAEALKNELIAIERRQSNIPSQSLQIRSTICEALDISEDGVPFAGELIRVNEKAWESSAERLLRSFGLLLLVDERHYEKVAKFVNKNNLKGKLEFERINTSESFETSASKNDGSFIYSKIEIKPNTPFKDWLRLSLKKRFNYTCCDSVEELTKVERGLTKEGLIKHSFSRHMKDDRQHVSGPSGHILGWNNKEKIAALQKLIQSRLLAVAEAQGFIKTNRLQSENLSNARQWAEKLLVFEYHRQVDVDSPAQQIESTNKRIEALVASSKSLQKLKSKEKSIIDEISKAGKKNEELIGDIRSKSDSIGNLESDLEERRKEISLVAPKTSAELFPSLDLLTEELGVNFSKDKPEKIKDLLSKKNMDEKSALTFERSSSANTITSVMRQFKDKYHEDSTDLLPNLEFTTAFLSIYKKLVEDDLPRFETQYRKMFTKDVLDRVTLLHSELYKVEAEIRETIEFINTPLETVAYNSGTKIKILAHSSSDRTVKEFQVRIRDCLPKVSGNSESVEQDEAYARVKALVEYLQLPEKERERAKVLDVRNWVDFAAEEVNVTTGKLVQYYSGAAGRSGGQKAQLAFTVLASALAYQCGLTADAPSNESFNFVMIDEAFAKTDSMKSDMALKLFKNMGFQILVSSPDRDWDIVEPHVECVHLAFGNEERNHSEIYTVSLEEASLQLGRPLGKRTWTQPPGEMVLQ